jgi:hypothetical protein
MDSCKFKKNAHLLYLGVLANSFAYSEKSWPVAAKFVQHFVDMSRYSSKRYLSNYRKFQPQILTFVKNFDYENSCKCFKKMSGRILVLPLSPEHEARHAQHILLQVSCNKTW